MSTDELIYESLVPQHVKHVLTSTVGLTMPTAFSEGVDWRSIVAFLLVVAQLSWALSTYLVPQLSVLQGVSDAICAGDQEFVYAIDGIGTVVWGYPSNVNASAPAAFKLFPTLEGEEQTLDYNQQTIDSLLNGHGRGACPAELCYNRNFPIPVPLPQSQRAPCCIPRQTKAPTIQSGKFSIRTKATADLVEATSVWNPACGDLLDLFAFSINMLKGEFGKNLRPLVDVSKCGGYCPAEFPYCTEGVYLPDLSFNASVKGVWTCRDARCADVVPYCNGNTVIATRARMMCPVTCGCDQPRSPLALSLDSEGCPTRCKSTAAYKVALQTTPCEDVPKNDTNFVHYLDNWKSAAADWPKDWSETALTYVELLRTYGCDYLRYTSAPALDGNSWPADFWIGYAGARPPNRGGERGGLRSPPQRVILTVSC